MVVKVIKFSEFADGSLAREDNIIVGLGGDFNNKFPKDNVWSTDTRPDPAPNGITGFNTTLQLVEYYDSILGDWVQLEAAGAIFDATFITQIPEPSLPNSQALSDLETGVMLSHTVTGVITTVEENIATDRKFLSQIGSGVSSTPPTWEIVSGGDIPGQALTTVSDTNVTLTRGGTPDTALLEAASITAGWAGQLGLTRGGTNASLTADNGGMVYSTASELAILAATATAGQIIRSAANAAPSWSTATYPNTISEYGMLFCNVTNEVSVLPSGGNSCVLVTSLIGKPTWSGSLSDGQFIIGRTGNTPIPGTITGSTYIAITAGIGSVNVRLTGLPFPATIGGTGLDTYALGDTIYSSATDTLSILPGNITTSKLYLSQTGTGAVSAAPAWAAISGGDITGAALTKTDDTNVTITLGGTPTTALLRAASLTMGWTGQLGLTRGGTNASLTADNGGIVYSSASALAILASTATAGKVLQSGSSTTPAWSTPTYPSASGSAGKILISDGTNNIYSTPTYPNTATTGNIIYASASNTYSVLAPNTSATKVQYLSMINSVATWFTPNDTNPQSGTTYTVVLADLGKLVTFNNASPITVTLPQQSTTATSAGFFCWFLNIGAGLVTIVKEGAETLAGNTTLAQNAECKIERPTTTSWSTFGGTATVNFEFSVMATTVTANQVLTFTENASCAGTILSVAQAAATFGTAGTYSVAINGSVVSGLSAVVQTTSRTITAATAGNTFSVGDIITLTQGVTVITGTSYIATLVYSRTF